MDNHPIPQDITGFQFRLIGNMTIKQFAYVGSGVLIGWFFYALPLPVFITYPIALFFVVLGFSLAFVPVEGRPFDVMIANFIRALFTPNEYVFQKTGQPIFQTVSLPKALPKQKELPTISKSELHTYLQQTTVPHNALDQKEATFFSSLTTLTPTGAPTPAPTFGIPTIPSIQPKETKKVDLPSEEEVKYATPQKETVVQESAKPVTPPTATTVPVPAAKQPPQPNAIMQQQLLEALAQKQQLEQQLRALQQQFMVQKQQPVAPVQTVPATPPPVVQTQPNTATPVPALQSQVKKIAKPVPKNNGLPLMPDAPNLIMGLVKNPRGNILANILVEVKDQEGNPVRAFKTNALGQFASATSLPNGTYTIEFEDPKGENTFDALQITASGSVLQPMEIISQDQREALRKALFTQ